MFTKDDGNSFVSSLSKEDYPNHEKANIQRVTTLTPKWGEKNVYLDSSSHFKNTPPIDLFKMDFINSLTSLTSFESKVLDYKSLEAQL